MSIDSENPVEKKLADWQERQRVCDARDEERHRLGVLDVNSCINHRAVIEGYLAAQVETNKAYNAIAERTAVALERIADSLDKPITLTKWNEP